MQLSLLNGFTNMIKKTALVMGAIGCGAFAGIICRYAYVAQAWSLPVLHQILNAILIGIICLEHLDIFGTEPNKIISTLCAALSIASGLIFFMVGLNVFNIVFGVLFLGMGAFTFVELIEQE